jgi:hypothetical protein
MNAGNEKIIRKRLGTFLDQNNITIIADTHGDLEELSFRQYDTSGQLNEVASMVYDTNTGLTIGDWDSINTNNGIASVDEILKPMKGLLEQTKGDFYRNELFEPVHKASDMVESKHKFRDTLKDSLVRKIGETGLYVVDGDFTKKPVDSIITVINSNRILCNENDKAIKEVAGENYHIQVDSCMPLDNKGAILTRGNRVMHDGQFNDAIFLINNLYISVSNLIYRGLESSIIGDYQTVAIPANIWGIPTEKVEEYSEIVVAGIVDGVNKFTFEFSGRTNLRNIVFVTNQTPLMKEYLQKGLMNISYSS